MFKRRNTCRVCKKSDVVSFLDFGPLPLAGGFVEPGVPPPDPLIPLDVAFCRNCSLVQILNVVDANILFKHYYYLSSVTTTLSKHFETLAHEVGRILSPKKNPFVVEMGCNDGVFLVPLQQQGIACLGVDGSENVSKIARSRGVNVVTGFFGPAIAEDILKKYQPADIFVASNVFAHIDDMDAVMQGLAHLLAPDGTFICEVHYVGDLLEKTQFDTIYHEHLCYYSLFALQTLFDRYQMQIVDVVRTSIHAGSIRIYVKRKPAVISSAVEHLRAYEASHGIRELVTYQNFAARTLAVKNAIFSLCSELVNKNKRLVGYGAAGRATTLLNYCHLGTDILHYVVDESPLRAGRFVPGVRLPIVKPEVFRQDHVDYAIILAWNYEAEIRAKESGFTQRGGKFVVPLPEVKVDH